MLIFSVDCGSFDISTNIGGFTKTTRLLKVNTVKVDIKFRNEFEHI